MKKFKFRLQRVLEFRHTLTKEKERELMKCNQELQSAEQRVEEILAAQDTADGGDARVTSMAELIAEGDYYRALQNALVCERLHVLEAAEAVERAREAYVEKAIEEESLVKLKERKLEQHREEVRKFEKKELDALVTQRYRFGKDSEG